MRLHCRETVHGIKWLEGGVSSPQISGAGLSRAVVAGSTTLVLFVHDQLMVNGEQRQLEAVRRDDRDDAYAVRLRHLTPLTEPAERSRLAGGLAVLQCRGEHRRRQAGKRPAVIDDVVLVVLELIELE